MCSSCVFVCLYTCFCLYVITLVSTIHFPPCPSIPITSPPFLPLSLHPLKFNLISLSQFNNFSGTHTELQPQEAQPKRTPTDVFHS